MRRAFCSPHNLKTKDDYDKEVEAAVKVMEDFARPLLRQESGFLAKFSVGTRKPVTATP
ncbi:MAG: hypothetical protein ACRDHZ_07370 [Ktedonobacteraceae bacterium]